MKTPTVGDQLGGFLLTAEIGAGGFAKVYLATSSEHGTVALKILTPDDGESYATSTRVRFDRETEILRSLSAPSTVKFVAAGTTEEGLLYLATEHVQGEDLAAVLDRRGRVTSDDMVQIARQILASLAEAHRAGLVHRDIKPENIRVVDTPMGLHATLLDFGIARGANDSHPSVTRTGELIGTPRYMSPEQLTGRPLTPRSDLYSLGLVMFEMLLGREALHGNRWADQLERLQSGHVFALPDGVSEPGILNIIQKMTTSDPQHRYASADAVLGQLDLLTGDTKPYRARPRGRPLRDRRVVGLVVGLSIAAVGLLAWLLVPRDVERRQRSVVDEPRSGLRVPEKLVTAPPPRAAAKPVTGSGSSGCGHRPPTFDEALAARTPASYDRDKPHPLIIAFHKDYVSPFDWLDNPTMRRLADDASAVIVAPVGTSPEAAIPFAQAWRDQKPLEIATWARDEALFSFCIDPTRIYVLGHSDGVRTARKLSCEEWVSAVALMGHALDENDKRICDRPKPTLWLHTVKSPRVPERTGPTCTKHVHLGTRDTETYLRRWTGCAEKPRPWPTEPKRICRASCGRVVFCEVDGGATWPGETQHILDAVGVHAACVDDPTPGYDATADIWRFFSAHPAAVGAGDASEGVQ